MPNRELIATNETFLHELTFKLSLMRTKAEGKWQKMQYMGLLLHLRIRLLSTSTG